MTENRIRRQALVALALVFAFVVPTPAFASHGFVHFFPLYYVALAPPVPGQSSGIVQAVRVKSKGIDGSIESEFRGTLFMSDLLGEKMDDNAFPTVTLTIILRPGATLPSQLTLAIDLFMDGKLCDPPTSKIWCKKFTGWMSDIDRLKETGEKLRFAIDMKKIVLQSLPNGEGGIEYVLPRGALDGLKIQRANIQRAVKQWKFEGFDARGNEVFSVLRATPLGWSRKRGS